MSGLPGRDDDKEINWWSSFDARNTMNWEPVRGKVERGSCDLKTYTVKQKNAPF